MFLAVTSFYLLCLEFIGLPESILESLLSHQILFISKFLKSIFLRSYYLTHQDFFTLSFVVVVQLLSCVWLLQSHGLQHPGFPVLHYLPEFAQTHGHWVSDVIQPSHLLLPLPHPILNLSQHEGLFQWVSSSHQAAKILELQHQSFQWLFRVDCL